VNPNTSNLTEKVSLFREDGNPVKREQQMTRKAVVIHQPSRSKPHWQCRVKYKEGYLKAFETAAVARSSIGTHFQL
jgi:hypothetical protein